MSKSFKPWMGVVGFLSMICFISWVTSVATAQVSETELRDSDVVGSFEYAVIPSQRYQVISAEQDAFFYTLQYLDRNTNTVWGCRNATEGWVGYDTKNAAHLIRLLRMGIEYLKTGELEIERHDSAHLLSIKRGEKTLEEVKAEAIELFANADHAYARSNLPPKPDREGVESLLVEIVRDWAPGGVL